MGEAAIKGRAMSIATIGRDVGLYMVSLTLRLRW